MYDFVVIFFSVVSAFVNLHHRMNYVLNYHLMYSHVDLIAEYQRKINLQDNIKIFITFMLIESHLKINFNVQFPFLNFMSMLNSFIFIFHTDLTHVIAA